MNTIHDYRLTAEESRRYAAMADEAMQWCDTLVLSGNNCGLKVSNKALHIKQGSLVDDDRDPIIYYKGTVPIRTIVLLAHSGTISINALHWCKDQGISIVMLDNLGNSLYSMSPESDSNAKLRRLQYQADYTGMKLHIASEIVRRKTLAQIAVLKSFPKLKDSGETTPIYMGQNLILSDSNRERLIGSICEVLDDGLHELADARTVAEMQGVEGKNANFYWNAYTGIPLQWCSRDEKIVPPHWKKITDRPSSLSGNSPRRAVCPFHAALNYLYGVAEHWLLCSIRASGLDPACAFLHADHAYRDSLVYDLIEEHRASIDKKVLEFFECTELRRGDILMLPSGQINLNKELCRYLIVSCLPDVKKLGLTVQWLVKTLTGKQSNWMQRLDL